MLYHAYQFSDDVLAPLRLAARWGQVWSGFAGGPAS